MAPEPPPDPPWFTTRAKTDEISHLSGVLRELLFLYHQSSDDLAARRLRRSIANTRADLARAVAELGRQLDAPATWRRSAETPGSLHG